MLDRQGGAQGRTQDIGQGGPAEFWPQIGWAQNVLKIGVFKIAWKLHDFEKILGQAPLDANLQSHIPWVQIRYPVYFSWNQSHTKDDLLTVPTFSGSGIKRKECNKHINRLRPYFWPWQNENNLGLLLPPFANNKWTEGIATQLALNHGEERAIYL